MAFGQRILTTTRLKLMPKVVDTVLNSNVLATRMLGAAKKWSGETMKFPVKVTTNTTFQTFSGFDVFSTAAVETRQNMVYDPKFAQITVSLPLDELSVNGKSASEESIIDLMALEVKSSAQDMADQIGTLFYGDGTGNGGKDFNGLANLVDDGTVAPTIGGLSRATFPTLKGTVISNATLSLAGMSTLYNSITSGSQNPTLGIGSEQVFAFYESLLQPQERVVKDVAMFKSSGNMGKAGTGFQNGTGYTGLFYKGFPVLADEKATAGQLFFLNEDYLDWYALPMAETEPVKYKSVDIEGNDYSDVLGLGFSWSGWIKPANAAATIGHIYLGGQFLTDNPKRQGKQIGITGV